MIYYSINLVLYNFSHRQDSGKLLSLGNLSFLCATPMQNIWGCFFIIHCRSWEVSTELCEEWSAWAGCGRRPGYRVRGTGYLGDSGTRGRGRSGMCVFYIWSVVNITLSCLYVCLRTRKCVCGWFSCHRDCVISNSCLCHDTCGISYL